MRGDGLGSSRLCVAGGGWLVEVDGTVGGGSLLCVAAGPASEASFGEPLFGDEPPSPLTSHQTSASDEHDDADQQQPAYPVHTRRQRPRRTDDVAHRSTLTAVHSDLWHHRHDMPQSPAYRPVVAWYAASARDLPWRRPDAGPWAVLVSEVMLQQTPVHRVLPVYVSWLERWPTPSALAQDSVGEAIRAWGRLGYPRRARRLWEAARVIDRDFDGVLPATEEQLRSLPGVGAYTAAAVCAFAYRRRAVVLDTNVRRVLSRARRWCRVPAGRALGRGVAGGGAARPGSTMTLQPPGALP